MADTGGTGLYGSGTGFNIVGQGGVTNGLWAPSTTNTIVPSTYYPGLISGGTSFPYQLGVPIKTLKDILGLDFEDFIVVPTHTTFGSGVERCLLSDLMSKLNNVPYVELGGEIAIAPEVWHALVAYTKMGDEYAGLGIVEFLNKILSREKQECPVP